MVDKKMEIIEKWMSVNYPDILSNPEEVSNSCCLYRSKCGNYIYLTHIYNFFSYQDEYKEPFKDTILLNNDFEKFFFNTFGEDFREHLLSWFRSKIHRPIMKIH